MKKDRLIYLFVLLVVLVSSCKTIQPTAPPKATMSAPPIKQPVSNIDVPVTADLSSYFKQADDQVPKSFDGSDQPCTGLRYSYHFQRDPLNIAGHGNTIQVTDNGQYWIQLSYCAACLFNNCIVPKIDGSCGTNGEPLRGINIGYTSVANVEPDYHLQTTTHLTTLNPTNRCTFTILGIDATDRLVGFVRGQLDRLAGTIDAKVAGVSFKPQVQNAWNSISKEIPIGSYGYLSINPQSLRLSSLNMTNNILNFSVGMSAQPVFSTASSPLPVSPLPNLSSYTPANGFNIFMDLTASYQSLSKTITQKVAGQTINIAGKKFVIDSAVVYATDPAKIVLAVYFKGWRKGIVYLVGTPEYNSVSDILSFPDLTFDIQTKSLLLKLAKWILNDKITTTLRQKATDNLSPILTDGKTKLQDALNKDYGNNIKTKGTVNNLNLQGIYPTNSVLYLRALTNGQLELLINP